MKFALGISNKKTGHQNCVVGLKFLANESWSNICQS